MSDGASERRRDEARQRLSDDRERLGATVEELEGRATPRGLGRRRWIVGLALAGLATGVAAVVVVRARARSRRRFVRAARAVTRAGPHLASAGRRAASSARAWPAGTAAIVGAAAGVLTGAALVRARLHAPPRGATVGELNFLSSLSGGP